MTLLAEFEDGPKAREIPLTIEAWEVLEEAGRFEHIDGKIELIDGRLYAVAPLRPDHSRLCGQMLAALTFALERAGFGSDWFVGDAATLVLSESYGPVPDIVVARRSHGKYLTPADVALVVEVALSSHGRDRNVKAADYARGGVREFWIVDVEARRLEVRRRPAAHGYATSQTYEASDAVSPEFAPEAVVQLATVFR